MELSDAARSHPDAAWNEWSLRDELLAASQRWYLIFIWCLIGAMLGWLAAQVWPSPHRVSKELFVGLNVYQSAEDRSTARYAGLPFANANDYKNWQMASLNTLVFMDPVLDDTLTHLRALDPYWRDVDRDELADMLGVYWRNAGKWRLVARHETPMYATQAVILWQDAVIETVHKAVASAQYALEIDEQRKAIAAARADLAERAALLSSLRRSVIEQQLYLGYADTNAELEEDHRSALIQSLLPAEDLGLSSGIESESPPPGAPVSAYRAWLAEFRDPVSKQLSAVRIQADYHQRRQAELSQQFTRAMRGSLGLSAELLVQKISDRRLDAGVVRPTGVSVLVGAGLGFLIWVFVWLIRPGIKTLR